jgi:hypothetical protein
MPESQNKEVRYRVNPELKNAISEAQLLLAFASRHGHSLTEETVNIIVKSGMQDEISEADETAFWKHFAILAAAVAPVSAESVRAIATVDGKRSQVQKTVRRFTITAVVALAVLVTLQAYWAVGALIISDMKTTQAQLKEVELSMRAGSNSSGNESPGQQQLQQPQQQPQQQQRPQRGGRNFTWLWEKALEGPSEELKFKKEDLEMYVAANYRWLELWSTIPNSLLGIDTIHVTEKDPEDAIRENIIAYLQCATITMDILQKYILPLIYGFLGACVYVLRNLSSKIKAYAFLNASTINFHIRLCLGTLGGIAIVWFISPEKTTEPVMSLSPLALAFLAGYSVELLFAVMDTVINAFTGNRTASPKEEQTS